VFALALVDQVSMATISQLAEKLDDLTAHFAYIRWVADRKGVEQKTKTRDKIVSREREKQVWIRYGCQFLRRGEIVYAYYDDRYAARAPSSTAPFHKTWGSCERATNYPDCRIQDFRTRVRFFLASDVLTYEVFNTTGGVVKRYLSGAPVWILVFNLCARRCTRAQIDVRRWDASKSNQTTIGWLRTSVRGTEATIVWNRGGSFHDDGFKNLSADFILTNPPLNNSTWRAELLERRSGGCTKHC
jgi:hypothetical protein